MEQRRLRLKSPKKEILAFVLQCCFGFCVLAIFSVVDFSRKIYTCLWDKKSPDGSGAESVKDDRTMEEAILAQVLQNNQQLTEGLAQQQEQLRV